MVFSLALKDERIEQCLRYCGNELQVWGPKQEHSLHLQFICPLNAIHHSYWGKLDFNVGSGRAFGSEIG